MKAGDRAFTVAWDGRILLWTVLEVGPEYMTLQDADNNLGSANLTRVHPALCVFCGHELLPADEVTLNPAANPFALMDYARCPAHTNCCHRAAIDAAAARHAAQ